nr:immunoglobulin heavy chain junction region [Mus musculus]
CARHDDYFDYW